MNGLPYTFNAALSSSLVWDARLRTKRGAFELPPIKLSLTRARRTRFQLQANLSVIKPQQFLDVTTLARISEQSINCLLGLFEQSMMNDEQRASEAVFGSGGEPTGRLYNPYQDLYGAADLKSLESVYRLPSAPEYLFPDEAAVQRRNWSENLTYYTGCGYGAGAILGGVRGGIEGLRSQEATDTTKIRVNRLLNASGHRGRTMGNAFGILGLLYAGFESTASHYRGSDDMLNTVIAGLGTGVVYKAAAGPRTAAIAGALGGAAAAGLAAAKQLSKRYSPI